MSDPAEVTPPMTTTPQEGVSHPLAVVAPPSASSLELTPPRRSPLEGALPEDDEDSFLEEDGDLSIMSESDGEKVLEDGVVAAAVATEEEEEEEEKKEDPVEEVIPSSVLVMSDPNPESIKEVVVAAALEEVEEEVLIPEEDIAPPPPSEQKKKEKEPPAEEVTDESAIPVIPSTPPAAEVIDESAIPVKPSTPPADEVAPGSEPLPVTFPQEEEKKNSVLVEPDEESHAAATRLQNLKRAKDARTQVKKMREEYEKVKLEVEDATEEADALEEEERGVVESGLLNTLPEEKAAVLLQSLLRKKNALAVVEAKKKELIIARAGVNEAVNNEEASISALVSNPGDSNTIQLTAAKEAKDEVDLKRSEIAEAEAELLAASKTEGLEIGMLVDDDEFARDENTKKAKAAQEQVKAKKIETEKLKFDVGEISKAGNAEGDEDKAKESRDQVAVIVAELAKLESDVDGLIDLEVAEMSVVVDIPTDSSTHNRAATKLQNLKRAKDAKALVAEKRAELVRLKSDESTLVKKEEKALADLIEAAPASPPAIPAEYQKLIDEANARANASENALLSLRAELSSVSSLELKERMRLEESEAKAKILTLDLQAQRSHDKAAVDIDSFLQHISTEMSDEHLTASVTQLVEEYLVFCDYRNTVDCLNSETKCMRFKPTFGLNNERTAVERAEKVRVQLLRSFDEGDATTFFSIWTSTVPPNLLSSSKSHKVLALKLQIHFAMHPLKKRIVFDPSSAYPCSTAERAASANLKQVLHEAAEDQQLMNDDEMFAFFTLSSLTHPHTHPSFGEKAKADNAIFTERWTTMLREDLGLFCATKLPLISPPRLVALFQAFNKWETSLQAHVVKSTQLSTDMADLTAELLGQNVKLLTDMQSKAPGVFDQMYYQNMRRYIITAKERLVSLKRKISPSTDVEQSPPLSYKSLNSFLATHETEKKLVGHVLRALCKRFMNGKDPLLRQHAAHDASVGNVLTFFNGGKSVIINLLNAEKKTTGALSPGSPSSHLSRATYYASLLVASMSKFKISRVYLCSEGEGRALLGGLVNCFENSLSGETCLEAGVTCLVALQRLTVEKRFALAAVKFGLISRISALLEKLSGFLVAQGGLPRNLFFLAHLMLDEDVTSEATSSATNPEYASPVKRQHNFSAERSWGTVSTSMIRYGTSLLLNLCGGFHGPKFEKAYESSRSSSNIGGEEDWTLKNLIATASNLNANTNTNTNTKNLQITCLSSANALLTSPAARNASIYKTSRDSSVNIDVESCGNEKAYMLAHLQTRLNSAGGNGEEEVVKESPDNEGEVDVLEDEVDSFPWDVLIESGEGIHIHAAIDKNEVGELPEGWKEGIDMKTGGTHFFKSDGSSIPWVLPSTSEEVLKAFFLSKF